MIRIQTKITALVKAAGQHRPAMKKQIKLLQAQQAKQNQAKIETNTTYRTNIATIRIKKDATSK